MAAVTCCLGLGLGLVCSSSNEQLLTQANLNLVSHLATGGECPARLAQNSRRRTLGGGRQGAALPTPGCVAVPILTSLVLMHQPAASLWPRRVGPSPNQGSLCFISDSFAPHSSKTQQLFPK